MSIHACVMPLSHNFNCCNLVIGFEKRRYQSCYSLLFQKCFGYLRSLEISYESQKVFSLGAGAAVQQVKATA